MRFLILLISLLSITNVFAANTTTVKLKQLDVIHSYETLASDVSFIKTFNDELIQVKDQRSIPLGETDSIDGIELRQIDKVFLKNPIRKLEKGFGATRRRKGGNGSGGSH